MAEKSSEERIAAIEAQLGNVPIEEHFREQAELIDRVFACRLDECERKWEATLDSTLESKLESLLESKLEAKLKPMRIDLALVKHAVGVILSRLT